MRRAAGAALVAVLVALASGCAAAPAPAAPGADADVDLPEAFALAADFPDPDVLALDDGGYLAYGTQSESAHVQLATSPDLDAWTVLDEDALPELPSWAVEGDTWAPDVAAWQGGYLLFHTSTDAASGSQCIGVARSESPTGPFRDTSSAPLVCPVDGAIDASFFVDADGRPYLLWKIDSNCCGGSGSIWISPLSPDGAALAGPATELLAITHGWEGRVIEAPTLRRGAGGYDLLYSAGDYASLDYSIGWASSPTLLGPYTSGPEPLLSTESSDFAFIGPGGQDVVDDRLVFHSWDAAHEFRGLHSVPLRWGADGPSVELPRPPD